MTYRGHPDQAFGCVSYAQHGDDFMILNLFRLIGIDRPSYLDLGAHHPTVISNTKLLYDRGSRGVNVEANPSLIAALETERPGDVTVHIGVGTKPGLAPLYVYGDASGRNTFSTEEVRLEGSMAVKRAISVEVKTISQIVVDHCPGGVYPDLLSCDIEGLDFEVLESARFHQSAPIVVCVETRRGDSERMTAMMAFKGFFPYCRMLENLFFVRCDLRARVY